MPIKNKALYPKDWATVIRPAILARAGNCCEECGVQNYAVGARDVEGEWYDEDSIHCMNSDVGYAHFGDFPDMIKIVLTISHTNHTVTDNDPSNLRALCQRCHNRHDVEHRKANRAITIAEKQKARAEEKRAQSPQLELAF